jgi:hypothetical protein
MRDISSLDAISKQRRSPTFIVIAKPALCDFLSEPALHH